MTNYPFGNSYPNYAQPYQTYPQYQQPQNIPVAQIPVQGVKFVSEEEARAYLPQPNTKVLLMNKDKAEFYIKTADFQGQTFLEVFEFAPKNGNAQNAPKNEPTFVGKDELKEYVKSSDLSDFATKKDLEKATEAIKRLEQRIAINDILTGKCERDE